MKTYAEYLNTMTVKALNTIARDMGLKGYSKLRKADLVAFLDSEISALMPTILSVEVAADAPAIAEIMATVAPVTFSATPVKAPESVPAASDEADATEDEGDEILYAYRAMRATFRTARGSLQVKLATRLRTLGAQLKACGYNMREV